MTTDKTDDVDRTVADNLSPLGLSIDMLDVDQLRRWALTAKARGEDAVADRMAEIATGAATAVKDIGTLRDAVATLTAQRNDLIVALARSQDALAAATRLIEDAR